MCFESSDLPALVIHGFDVAAKIVEEPLPVTLHVLHHRVAHPLVDFERAGFGFEFFDALEGFFKLVAPCRVLARFGVLRRVMARRVASWRVRAGAHYGLNLLELRDPVCERRLADQIPRADLALNADAVEVTDLAVALHGPNRAGNAGVGEALRRLLDREGMV